jgi:hypothetical protein
MRQEFQAAELIFPQWLGGIYERQMGLDCLSAVDGFFMGT